MGTLNWRQIGSKLNVCLLALVLMLMAYPVTSASAETRSLNLYFLHTGERAKITYKRNGRYISSGLTKINKFLRDWRRNEPTKMDPRLLDLIWEVYQQTGSNKPIHVISAYRSPATNSLLRKRGRGVARKSQHTLGKALDFFIPGVSLRKLRNIGLKKGIGGVGYYPKSGSPFVHMDTGSVRHWPRMSRKELVKVFPRGKTLHVPTDGKPLARYNQAKAEYERKVRGAGKIQIAKAEEIEKKPGLFARILNRGGDDDEDTSGAVAGTPKPVRTTTTTVAAPSPVPATPVTTPEPAAPVATPETVLASLPSSSLPVPLSAPRISTPASEPIVEDRAPLPEETPEEPLLEIASIVPVRRPAFEQQVPDKIQATEEQTGDSDTATVEIAAAEIPAAPTTVAQSSRDIFSPNEIQDLRKQVYAAIRAERENIRPAAPTPAIEIGSNPVQIAGAGSTPVAETATQLSLIPTQRPASSSTRQAFASVLKEPNSLEPGVASTGTTPVPTAVEREVSEQPLITAQLDPLDDETLTSTGEGVPLPNPNREDETPQAAQPETNEPADIVTAGIAVPSRAERPASIAAAIAQEPAPATQQVPATRELERLETANLEERLVGKWALAANTSISQIAEINPPAYGLNALREIPETVLSRGFSRDQVNNIEQGFTGSSIEFLDFTRFN